MPGLETYMDRYDREHHNRWNKLLHGIGIPMILAGIVLLFIRWQWGLGLFAGGWVLLFTGHKIEGNNPAFFQGPIYFLVGPLWVAKELKEALFGRSKPASNPQNSSPAEPQKG
jgi:uncharacterized membrane protein YGL010W